MRISDFSLAIMLAIAFLLNNNLLAQVYDGEPCKQANPALKSMFKQGDLKDLVLDSSITGSWAKWSSSFLKNTNKIPARPPNYDAETDQNFHEHKWSCRYSAGSAVDGKPATAWSEGVQGNGIGEILIVPVDTSKGIRIWAGLGKSDRLFKANNRPKKIRVYFLDARKQNPTEIGMIYSDIKIVGSNTQTLKDRNGYQSIGRPKHLVQGKSLIAIEILSVYPGNRWKDTVISEIKN